MDNQEWNSTASSNLCGIDVTEKRNRPVGLGWRSCYADIDVAKASCLCTIIWLGSSIEMLVVRRYTHWVKHLCNPGDRCLIVVDWYLSEHSTPFNKVNRNTHKQHILESSWEKNKNDGMENNWNENDVDLEREKKNKCEGTPGKRKSKKGEQTTILLYSK